MSRFRLSVLGVALVLTTGSAWAADTAPVSDLPDISPIRAQIYVGDYAAAIEALLPLAQENSHPDLFNLLGFSYRKLGRYDEAGKWYREALYFDGTHRPALEYQGELFIATGDIEAARKNLHYLQMLCGQQGCAEVDQLTQALADAGHASQAAP